MKENKAHIYPAGGASSARARMSLLVIPALLAVFAAAGSSSPAFADPGGTDGTVTVTADTQSVPPGGVVAYTITVKNGSQAGIVTVIDNLPSHTTLLDAPGCTPRNDGSVSCDFAMFPFDVASTTISVQVDTDANCNWLLRDSAHVHGWPMSSVDVEIDCGAP
jgi:uncharacterized repeat protein (TIGR01451 family)